MVDYSGFEVAIIGMSCRLPGAKNIQEYWNNIKNGKESISSFTLDELKKEGLAEDLLNKPNYIRAKGIVDDLKYFDPKFFRLTAQEASIMDPQMRLMMKCTWEALEDSGYAANTKNNQIGVYIGASDNFDWRSHVYLSNTEMPGVMSSLLLGKDLISTQLAYKLDLQGPGISLFSACSSSLVSVHMACQAIISGDCDIALAGASAVSLPQKKGYLYEKEMICSEDGHCRPFDSEASGTVFSDGAAIVVLKSLENALKDRDNIYAVIKGSALNNDGERKIGYTAPSLNGQAEVIKMAHQISGVDPSTIGYVETHGTGTIVGDPIEFEALKLAFGQLDINSCYIGSVKANIGHTDTVSGVAGLIKTALAVKNNLIPPSINYLSINPKIDIKNSPFYINTESKPFRNDLNPIRAGINSFGIGGTNVHVVVEQAPILPKSEVSKDGDLLLLSANSLTALNTMSLNLANYLKDNEKVKIEDVSYTLLKGRKNFIFRRKIFCHSATEAIEILNNIDNRKVSDNKVLKEKRAVFVFPGLGSLYFNITKGLYNCEPVYRNELNNCFQIVEHNFGIDLKSIVFPESNDSFENNMLHSIDINQLILFSIEYSLAKFLISIGIRAQSMIGYSFGEYAVACLAGVFSLVDAFKIIYKRGELLKKLPEGRMLSVPISKDEILKMLGEELSLAIDNGDSCVIAGPLTSIELFEKRMKENKIICFPLQNMNRAIHSKMLDPVLDKFEKYIANITLNAPEIPYISCVSGDWIKPEEATAPKYWVSQLRNTVQTSKSIEKLNELKDAVFIELGSGGDFSTLINREYSKVNSKGSNSISIVRTENSIVQDLTFFRNRIGQLWLKGFPVDWSLYFKDVKRNLISLPTYPFEEERYWIDEVNIESFDNLKKKNVGNIEKEEINKWLYKSNWKSQLFINAESTATNDTGIWLVFCDKLGFSHKCVEKIEHSGVKVICVGIAKRFMKISSNNYEINPENKSDYELLFNDLFENELLPNKILHFWGITEPEEKLNIKNCLNETFYSLLFINQVSSNRICNKLDICVITNNTFDILGTEKLMSEKAVIQTPLIVLSQENSLLNVKQIDIQLFDQECKNEKLLIDNIIKESYLLDKYSLISYRGNQRFIKEHNVVRIEESDNGLLKYEGVYLITGGLGRIGFEITKYLAEIYKAKIVLLGRSEFPDKMDWDNVLNSENRNEEICSKIIELKKLEKCGSEIIYLKANVAKKDELQFVLKSIDEKWGTLNGVFHTAGVADNKCFSIIETIEKPFCENQFDAKIYGLQALKDVLIERNLDFCFLTSSIASILGGIGFYAYSAGNCFMDEFVSKCNRISRFPWIAVSWDSWIDNAESKSEVKIGKEMLDLSLTYDQGIKIIEKALSIHDYTNIIVSTGDLNERIYKWIEMDSFEPELGNNSNELLSRPELITDYVKPENLAEEKLVEIWQEVLGFDEIGVSDNFFELGGDSLKLIRIRSRILNEFQIEIPIIDLFKLETISSVSLYLMDKEKHYIEPIFLVEKKEYYAASSEQRRMFFLQSLNPNSTSYNLPNQIALTSINIDKKIIESVFKELIARHESLRTSFHIVDNKIVQKVHENVSFTIEDYIFDEEVTDPLQHFIQPFDLSLAPLIRVGLSYHKEKPVLYVDIHHIITDETSFTILIEEFFKLYNGSNLEPIKFEYKDYSNWQKNSKNSQKHSKQEEYWINVFKGEIPDLNLPSDYRRPNSYITDGAVVEFSLTKDEIDIVENLINNDTTAYMTFLAIFNMFLFKITDQERIILGSVVSGRQKTEFENVLGMFVNTVVLSNTLSNEDSFIEILKKVKDNTLNAFANQDYQFEDLVEKLSPRHEKNRNPLFDVLFNMLNEPQTENVIKAKEHEYCIYDHKRQMAKFDLTFTVIKQGDHYKLNWEYSTSLFKPKTIENFIGYFRYLLSQLKGQQNIPISQLSIIPKVEEDNILKEFNSTNKKYKLDNSIKEIFEGTVERTPNSIALIYEDTYITYNFLNEKVNQFAYYLLNQGIKPNYIVALSLNSSIETIIIILSIQKIGATYLFIDSNYPNDRVNHILKDTATRFIIVSKRTLNLFKNYNFVRLILFDNEKFDSFSKNNPTNKSGANTSIYITYTSGSTGYPKGVIESSYGLLNRLNWEWETFPYLYTEKTCQKTSLNFVDHAAEIYAPLLKGIPLLVFSDDDRKDINLLADGLIKHRISRLTVVPSLLKGLLMISPIKINDLTCLRYVFSSGEELYSYIVRLFYEKLKYTTLINIYGSSEVSADVTYKKIKIFDIKEVLKYFQNSINVSDLFYGSEYEGNRIEITTPGIELENLAEKFTSQEILDYPIKKEEYFINLNKNVFPYAINTSSPLFIGHMTSVLPDFVHELSEKISRMNQNLVKLETSKSLLLLERETITLLHRRFYSFSREFYDNSIIDTRKHLGIVTSGGSISNISALIIARNRALNYNNSDEISSRNIYKLLEYKGYNDLVILGTCLLHYSFKKATSVLGLGAKNIIYIDTDPGGKLCIKSLKQTIKKCQDKNILIFAIIGIAGTTETGQIDPLEQMANIAAENNIHFHVDAAWGGVTIFSDLHKVKLKGIEKADSITICGHKQFYLPMGISVCLFKDPQSVNNNQINANYQAEKGSLDSGQYTIEGSRSALSLTLNASLNLLGEKGYELLIDAGIEKATFLANLLNKTDYYEVIGKPELNIVNFRFISSKFRNKYKENKITAEDNKVLNDINTEIQKVQFNKGKTFVSKTILLNTSYGFDSPIVVFRVVLSNPLTSFNDLFIVLEDQLEIASEICKESKDYNLIDIYNKFTQSYFSNKENDLFNSDTDKLNEVTIGKPISNTSIYIFDKAKKIVPVGIVGEIYVGGVNVSRGYLNNPIQSNECFVQSPYNGEEILYKTGDFAKWLPDGNIKFLGRSDDQIKIRGNRIEIGEIENAILNHKSVKECVVTYKISHDEEKYIVAYVLPKDLNLELNIKALKKHLAESIPTYMVPSFFVKLEQIPFTHTGKIDKKRLPDPEFNQMSSYEAPKSNTEKQLTNLIAEVLNIPSNIISLNSNFFDLGGNSLNATFLINKIKKHYKINILIKDVFEIQTVRELSSFVSILIDQNHHDKKEKKIII